LSKDTIWRLNETHGDVQVFLVIPGFLVVVVVPGFLVLFHVIPGLDPGIPADSVGSGNPRIKSGDDEGDEGAVRPAKHFFEEHDDLQPSRITIHPSDSRKIRHA
jgi:hypothetical protein